jgi:DNA repair exonuclease SbcCD ATPase subunit
MESMFVWTLIFAGATIGLLGIFLIASERELKAKRREIEELIGKVEAGPAAASPDGLPVPHATDGQTVAELMAQNKNLLAQISSLSDNLESSQKITEAHEILQRHLADYESENGQLQIANQRLHAEITDLKNQPSATCSTESVNESQEAADGRSQLEAELAELQQKLEGRQVQQRELEDVRQRLADAEARETVLRNRQQKLEERVQELNQEISARQQHASELEAIQTRLEESERLHRETCDENRRLQEEVMGWQERLTASEESKRQLAMVRQQVGELQSKQASIAAIHRQFQSDMVALAGTLDLSETDFTASSPEIRPISGGNIKSHVPAHSENASSIQLAREQINERRYYDALANLDSLLKEEPSNREAQLHHLLASIHLHGIQGYEDGIDSIKGMADLSESERTAARDIFLLRADTAQKCGQDNEMLRYRAWARNVIFRASFPGISSEPNGPAVSDNERNGAATASQLTRVDATEIDETNDIAQQAAGASRKRKWRFGIFSAIAVFALV